jgi:hypothetical protein
MDCLSEWDKDKRKKMEGRRYKADIDCGLAAVKLLRQNLNSNIEWVYIEGNHEERLARYLDRDPTFDGVVGIHQDLCPDWTWVPYRSNFMVRGTAYTHVPMNNMNKPVGGKYAVQKALDLYSCSVVFGHTHGLSVGCAYRHGATHLQQSLNIGCFFEGVDDYAVGSLTTYWRGIVVLNHYSTNRFDFESIALGRLNKEYGSAK